jgi:bla regulator protein blaR1
MNSLQWLHFITSYFLQASLVIGVAWSIERWVHGAQTKTRIWSACYLSLLILLVAGLALPRLQWLHPWSKVGPKELLAVAKMEAVVGQMLLAIWILGAAVMLVRWFLQFLEIRRFIASCPQWDTKTLARITEMASCELLTVHGRKVNFRQSPESYGPFCYQLHQPIVFLPISVVDDADIELRNVLQHELTHLATEHPQQVFWQKLAQVVLWFHPLVWISGQRAGLVREFVCDEAASGNGAATASYLRTLLRIVEQQSSVKHGTLTLGRTSGELKVRAQRLVAGSGCWNRSGMAIAPVLVAISAMLASQLWAPTNPLASPREHYSPWPSWTASILHSVGIAVRDFERFDPNRQMHELMENDAQSRGDRKRS